MASVLLREFIKEITYINRNPEEGRVLELLRDKSTNVERLIPAGEIFYRSRIIKDIKEIGKDKESGFWGFDQKGSFVAPKEATRDMRANYRYIPYLYIADNPRLAIYEIRPRYGARVSLASIRANEKLAILDFTATLTKAGTAASKQNLFKEISECFSKPVTEDDDIIDYIPTQYIAEFAKKIGYDGIAYTSSLRKEGNKGTYGTNYTIFNYGKMEAIRSNVFAIDQVSYEFKQEDDDNQKLFESVPGGLKSHHVIGKKYS